MNETLIVVIGALLILATIIVILKNCGKFRSKVYQLFILAEKEAKKGEKMNWVVQQIYAALPYPVALFLNEDALRWILQRMFNVVKDFLNDGKINRK